MFAFQDPVTKQHGGIGFVTYENASGDPVAFVFWSCSSEFVEYIVLSKRF